MSGWPDPDKPGVPLHHEQDGWHWLQNSKDNLWPWKWYAKTCLWGFPDPDVDADHMKRAKYHGPALTPTERDALPLAVAGIVSSMRVEMADGFRLAAKVALAALEPTDGTFYARDQGEHIHMKRAHERVKQKLEEAAEAWNIDMDEKP